MTQEDKMWIGGGVALAVGGGIYWYTQHKKSTDATATAKYITPINSLSTINNVKNQQLPTGFSYNIGQKIMTGDSRILIHKAIQKTDGSYIVDTDSTPYTMRERTKLGEIIWIGRDAFGNFNYAVDGINIILISSSNPILTYGKLLPLKKW